MPKRAKYCLPWYSNRSITSNTNEKALNKFFRRWGPHKFFWQSSPAGVSPGLLALDLACAPPSTPSVQRLTLRLLDLTSRNRPRADADHAVVAAVVLAHADRGAGIQRARERGDGRGLLFFVQFHAEFAAWYQQPLCFDEEPFDELRAPLAAEEGDVRLVVFDIPRERSAAWHVREVGQNDMQWATQSSH